MVFDLCKSKYMTGNKCNNSRRKAAVTMVAFACHSNLFFFLSLDVEQENGPVSKGTLKTAYRSRVR